MPTNQCITDYPLTKQTELNRQVAFHEAGHAVAVYCRNQHQKLPPVYFEITLGDKTRSPERHTQFAKLEGGRLIETLPHSLAHLSDMDKMAYWIAFEADIVNVLAGPLAEAKYVAHRDGEEFSRKLLNYTALRFYGGSNELIMVDNYVQCFVDNMEDRNDKIEQLLAEAFKFIDTPHYWQVIKFLAMHIIHSTKNIISCTEIINIIENARQHNNTERANISKPLIFDTYFNPKLLVTAE